MAFKLKFKNVKSTGEKASPFQQNQALISGAGDAAKSFVDVGGAFQAGSLGKAYSGGVSTSAAESLSESKNCVEQGLTGEALIKCQEKTNKDYLDNNKDPEDKEPGMLSFKEYKEQNPDATREDYRTYKETFKKEKQNDATSNNEETE